MDRPASTGAALQISFGFLPWNRRDRLPRHRAFPDRRGKAGNRQEAFGVSQFIAPAEGGHALHFEMFRFPQRYQVFMNDRLRPGLFLGLAIYKGE